MACIQSLSSASAISSSIQKLSTSSKNAPSKARFLTVRASDSDETPKASETPATPLPVVPEAPKVPKASTKFGDVFSFSGPAPETINGRLAMLGFTTALIVEKATGAPLSSQLGGAGLEWFVFSAALFSAASLIPMFQGITVESKSGGFFNSKAELLNGRAAMLGLVALALTEYVKGSPLI